MYPVEWVCVTRYESTKLSRNIKYTNDHKGSIRIIYKNKQGPTLTVHYIQTCITKDCKTKYYHGRYDKYHDRFSEEFENIELTVTLLNQKLGNRKSFSAELETDRVLEAVCTRRLQTRIEQDLGEAIFISWEQIQEYKTNQDKIICKQSDSSEKVLKKEWIDSTDLFNLNILFEFVKIIELDIPVDGDTHDNILPTNILIIIIHNLYYNHVLYLLVYLL